MTSRDEQPSAAAVDAFERYYQLGPDRSLRKLADSGVSNLRQLESWSSRYGWQELVLRRQEEEIQAARAAARREAAALARRRLQRAQVMQDAGLTILARARIQEMEPDEARKLIGDALRLLDTGIKSERLELGESTANVSATPPKPINEMTEAELNEWILMLERQAE